jgi:hypothetical protein
MAAMVALSRISHTGLSGLLSFIGRSPLACGRRCIRENAPVAILIPVHNLYSGHMDIALGYLAAPEFRPIRLNCTTNPPVFATRRLNCLTQLCPHSPDDAVICCDLVAIQIE